ncbi:MAG: hypothetical protein R3C68_05110 [Myxococcota bacterium]
MTKPSGFVTLIPVEEVETARKAMHSTDNGMEEIIACREVGSQLFAERVLRDRTEEL